MKEVTTTMYKTLDGTLFTSLSAAKQHEADLILAGVRPTEAQVTRNVARMYAIWLMETPLETRQRILALRKV